MILANTQSFHCVMSVGVACCGTILSFILTKSHQVKITLSASMPGRQHVYFGPSALGLIAWVKPRL